MSMKTLLMGKTFDEYVDEIKQLFIERSKEEQLDLMTPTFKMFMSKLPSSDQALLYYIVMLHKDTTTYIPTKTLAGKLREPVNVVSIWCKRLYDLGVVKRRKKDNFLHGVSYEYCIKNELFFKWFIMRNSIIKK